MNKRTNVFLVIGDCSFHKLLMSYTKISLKKGIMLRIVLNINKFLTILRSSYIDVLMITFT